MSQNPELYRIKFKDQNKWVAELGCTTQMKYAKKFKQHEGVMKLKKMRVDEGFDVVMELINEEEQ